MSTAKKVGAMIFQIRRQPLLWPILILFGVLPGRAFVALDDDRVFARFGFFTADVALPNVERWTITGPYRWWRAAGVRASIGQAELTFGGSTHGGVCLFLREPVRIARMGVRELYLTVDDLEGLAAALSGMGIPGRDLRAR